MGILYFCTELTSLLIIKTKKYEKVFSRDGGHDGARVNGLWRRRQPGL
jgi:hypothetical protein